MTLCIVVYWQRPDGSSSPQTWEREIFSGENAEPRFRRFLDEVMKLPEHLKPMQYNLYVREPDAAYFFYYERPQAVLDWLSQQG